MIGNKINKKHFHALTMKFKGLKGLELKRVV